MHPTEIQALLKRRGIKQAAIAKEFDVSRTVVGDVIQGSRRSERIEKRIAALLDLSERDLWPQWYGAPEEPAPTTEVLSRNEQILLRSFRAISREDQAEILASIQAIEAGFGVSPSSPEERLVVEKFRRMTAPRRAQMISDMLGDYSVDRSGVRADRGAIAAGRDVQLDKSAKRRK